MSSFNSLSPTRGCSDNCHPPQLILATNLTEVWQIIMSESDSPTETLPSGNGYKYSWLLTEENAFLTVFSSTLKWISYSIPGQM